MKTKLFAIAVLAAITLASCSKGEPGNSVSAPGEKTYVAVSVSYVTGSRASAGDLNATNAETKVNDITVFCYKADGTINGVPETLSSLTFTGAVSDKKMIATTTATKYVYAGVNFPAALVTAIKTNGTIAYLKSIAKGFTVAEISTANAFYMGGDVETPSLVKVVDGTPTENIPNSNKANIKIERFAAKVAVVSKNSVAGGNYEVKNTANEVVGKISSLTYQIWGINKSMFLAKNLNNGVVTDPNWVGYHSTYPALGSYGPESFVKGTAGKALNAGVLADKSTYTVIDYVLENSSSEFNEGESTLIDLKAIYNPQRYMEDDGFGNWDHTGGPQADNSQFWTVNELGAIGYFKTEAIAKAFCDAKGLPYTAIVHYPNGVCYYKAWLAKDRTFNVWRNDFIEVTVSSINNLGTPVEGPEKPDEPVIVPTNIELEFSIQPWNAWTEDWGF